MMRALEYKIAQDKEKKTKQKTQTKKKTKYKTTKKSTESDELHLLPRVRLRQSLASSRVDGRHVQLSSPSAGIFFYCSIVRLFDWIVRLFVCSFLGKK